MEQHQQQPAVSKARRSSQQILECLKEQRQGKLTVKEYCQANAIPENTFYRWQKIHGKQQQKKHKKQSKARSGLYPLTWSETLLLPNRNYLLRLAISSCTRKCLLNT